MTDLPKYELGEELAPCVASQEMIDILNGRRSTTAAMLTTPGPNQLELENILQIASRVPDHRRVAPYRFIVFEDDRRCDFGEVLKEAYLKNTPAADPSLAEVEKNRFLRAPIVVALIYSPNIDHKTPEWEQQLSVGAVGQNLLLAANAHGFAGQWLTEWYAFDPLVDKALGLEAQEKVAGYFYLGTAKENPRERARLAASDVTSRW